MKTIEVDIYVIVCLHHESSLGAEGGDPQVAHHCFVGEVPGGQQYQRGCVRSDLLVCVFKVALNDVLVDCTLSFQLSDILFLLSSDLSFLTRNAYLGLLRFALRPPHHEG